MNSNEMSVLFISGLVILLGAFFLSEKNMLVTIWSKYLGESGSMCLRTMEAKAGKSFQRQM